MFPAEKELTCISDMAILTSNDVETRNSKTVKWSQEKSILDKKPEKCRA